MGKSSGEMKWFVWDLDVWPAGANVESRYRAAGHISKSRRVRLMEGESLGKGWGKRHKKWGGKDQ